MARSVRKPKSAPATAAPRRGSPDFPAWLIAALLAVGTFALYWPALRNGFVNYDDDSYVTANARVQSGLTAENFRWAFTHTVAGNWHPLTVLSHMLVCQFYGLNPFGHHLVNVLLHAANAALVFILLRRLTGAVLRSAIMAALFAVHPLRVESVAWVAERKDVLSGFFGLLTLIAYAAYAGQSKVQGSKSKVPYTLALLFFALGLMSKPMLVTWPLVMLLLDVWPLRRIYDLPSAIYNLKPLLIEKIPFFLLATLAIIITFRVQQRGGVVATLQILPVGERVANAFVSYCRYLGKTFWPENLAVFYPLPDHLPPSLVAFAVVIVAGICVASCTLQVAGPKTSNHLFFTGWFWFVVTLLPVIGLVQVGQQAMADRYTYLPSLGILILIVWGAAEIFRRRLPQLTWLPAAASAAAIAACCILTHRQISFWQDGEALFRHSIAVTEENYVAHNNLGVALNEKHDTAGAMSEYQECLRLEPNFAPGHMNLGDTLDALGRRDDAIAEYRRALELDPQNDSAHNNLGVALFGQGRSDEAIAQFQAELRLQPDNFGAHNNLGGALYTLGRVNEAIEQFREAVRLKPDYADARVNLAKMLAATGHGAQAVREFQIYFQSKPQNAEARFYFGMALLNERQTNDAIAQFQEVLRLKPDYPNAREWLELAQKK
jgi:tetratricopeptide (TPR) repeat protein